MLAERMVDSLSKEGIIADEEREIVRFGLESLEGNMLGIVLTLTVGICFKRVEEAMLSWLWLFPLRKNAGGYHAATKGKCFFRSAAMLIAAFVLFTVFEHTIVFYMICNTVAGCVIWILAPVDNLVKRLDVLEHRIYQKRTRIVLGLEGVMFGATLFCKWEMAARSICMTFFVVTISLLMGTIKLTIYNKIDG